MTERITYIVQPAQGVNAVGYEVIREDAERATETDITMTPEMEAQEHAVEIAKEYARYYWEERGVPAQVKVRNTETGEFREEYSYGEDPERYEG